MQFPLLCPTNSKSFGFSNLQSQSLQLSGISKLCLGLFFALWRLGAAYSQ
jgi:hypothetical protein